MKCEGRCEYAHDVGMTEHTCAHGCMYEDAGPALASQESMFVFLDEWIAEQQERARVRQEHREKYW